MRGFAKARAAGARRVLPVSGLLLALIVVFALVPSTAVAGETRPLERVLDGTGSSVAITDPGGVAVDEATGNVFLNDATTHTEILGAENGAPAGLAPPYQLTGFSFELEHNGVAFDNSVSNGPLYVVTSGGKIKKFTRSPATERYELAGELMPVSPPGKTFSGNTAGAVVDADGNLYVAEFLCQCVIRFNSAGTQVATHSLSFRPSSLAVTADGDLFVRQAAATGSIFRFPADSSGEIDPANSTLVADAAKAVATDPGSDTLYIAFPDRVVQYDATTLTQDFEFGVGTLTQVARLAVNSATDRIYVSDRGKDNVAVFGPPVPIPTVTTKAASEITGTTATLNGVVDPEGIEVTDCKFEYGPTSAYGSTAPCEGTIPTDSSEHTVKASVASLKPNGATYHFRLVVNSANGPSKGADRTLITDDTVFTEAATAVGDTSATLNGFVRPEGTPLTECRFEYGTTTSYGQSQPCSPDAGSIPDDFSSHQVSAALSGLAENTLYHFRLVVANASETVSGEDLAFTTMGGPQILEQAPLEVRQTTAVLQARINPSGAATTYHFEWGTAKGSYGNRIPADHELFAGSGTDPVKVQASLSGLRAASDYHFRVVASSPLGVSVGADQPFQTLGENGLPDNRGFELVTPAEKGSSGSIVEAGFSAVQGSQASLDGESFMYPLQNGIDSSTAGGWLRQHAARSSSGWLSTQISGPALIPPPRVEFGIAQPSKLLFLAPDNSCGFLESYNPLTEDTSRTSVELGVENLYRWSAEDGDYDLVTNRLPLNPELSPPGNYYSQVESSNDCSRVYFRSLYELIPGGSGLYEWHEGTLRDAGVLPSGNVGADALFSGGGSVGRAILGGQVEPAGTAAWNAVSPDGARVFFTAIANEGPSAGTPAVFMREHGREPPVVEVSASETAVPTKGARFETASPDGSRVFFRANYGIDAQHSSDAPTNGACGPRLGETDLNTLPKLEQKPCALYVYDVETGELIDLSADANPADVGKGPQVQGTVAVDDDGSHVYFAALGELIRGKGRTYAENTSGFGSANIYLAHDGEVSYVTTLVERGSDQLGVVGDLLGSSGAGAALMRRSRAWGASTSATGDRLLFVSSSNLTGYETGGIDKFAAYVYSAETDRVSCVSCRPDGLPSIAFFVDQQGSTPAFHQSSWLLPTPEVGHRPRSMSADGSRVVFTTPDVLAPGGVAGKRNVYQWHEGQVSFLAVAEPGGVNGLRGFRGMSTDGKDVFIATDRQLAPQDNDLISDVYDIRVDGGFPFSEPPPDCQVDEAVALQPNQIYCQGDPSPQPPASGAASSDFSGPGNVAHSPPPCNRKQVRRGRRCVAKKALARRACAKRKGQAKRRCIAKKMKRLNRLQQRQNRAANSNRGGAK